MTAARQESRFCDSVQMTAETELVLRVRLLGGEKLDVTVELPDAGGEEQLTEHVIATLAADSGVLRARHGDRLVVLFGRGVAAVEMSPRGAVL